jgi:hypothetical protein
MFIDDQIYTLLSQDSELSALVTGIYNTLAPYNAEPPYVVFYVGDVEDDYTLAGRYRSVVRYEFFVCGRLNETETVYTAAQRIDELVNDYPFTGVLCFRRSGARFPIALSGGGETLFGITMTYHVEVSA